MENQNEIDIFFLISLLANLLQIENYSMNVKQISNDEIIQNLITVTDTQTQILLDRIESKMDRILENQDKIMRG